MEVKVYEIETRDGHTLWFAPYPATGEIFWDLNGLLVAFEVSADSTAADEAREGLLMSPSTRTVGSGAPSSSTGLALTPSSRPARALTP